MRIVIEIDGGEEQAAVSLPSTITITFPPEVGKAETAVSPGVDLKSAAGLAADVREAGPAPDIDPPPGDPPIFAWPDAADADALTGEIEAVDAGPAPAFESTEGHPATFAQADAQPAVTVKTGVLDAGVAAIGDQGIGFQDAGAFPEELFDAELGDDSAMAAADDLTAISGIGPKIAGVLLASGISTYAQIAASSVEELHRIMADAGISASVDSWPQQAVALVY